MKSKFIITVFFIFCFATRIYAQMAEKAFATIPPKVLNMLDKTARLDMIDLYNNNMKAVAENVYGGQSVMEEKNDDFISIRLTDVSQWQMRLFADGHDTLAVCVHTIAMPAKMSTVQSYHSDWRKAKNEFPQPAFEHFFIQKDDIRQSKYKSIIEQMQLAPVVIELHKTQPTLTYSLSIEALSIEDRRVASALIKPLTFEWQAGKFIFQNKEDSQPK